MLKRKLVCKNVINGEYVATLVLLYGFKIYVRFVYDSLYIKILD
jgi:hypothetical protein